MDPVLNNSVNTFRKCGRRDSERKRVDFTLLGHFRIELKPGGTLILVPHPS